MANKNYEKFVKHLSKIYDLRYASALLGWDQETFMPPKGANFRGQQMSTIASVCHELFVREDFGDLMENLLQDSSLTAIEKKNVVLTSKDYFKAKKYSEDFVVRISKLTSASFNAWAKAREESNFKLFQPYLTEMVEMKKEETSLLGFEQHPYDALIDQYEPDTTTEQLTVLFNDVRIQLVDFVKQISYRPQVDDSFLYIHYDKQQQWNFSMEMLKQMGYDFDAGRQDYSPHPFTTSFSMQDVRVTTRGYENDLRPMLWGSLHEGGHALYEQGLLVENYALPSGDTISLGIHESQSRVWENMIGRGLPFWKFNYNRLQKVFPQNLNDISLTQFYRGINKVQPSFIRVEADELTYHFHIMIRFEIEKGLMDGSIDVKNLPDIWNEKYKSYLNIEVPNDAQGVLQDVHWSHGSFGYFPTYSLGSFYSAQFFNQACKQIPDLIENLENGNSASFLKWLREKIHIHGKMFTADELCNNITGESLQFSYFMKYAKEKFSAVYEF